MDIYDVKITEAQHAILDKAKDLLRPFADKVDVEYSMTYFRKSEDGEEYSSEYDCCCNDKCIKAAKDKIRSDYGEDAPIIEVYTDTCTDHENFERCCICDVFFNESLAWVKWEIDRLDDYKTYDDFIIPDNAFMITGIYKSIPSCDYQIDEYHKHQLSLGNEKPLKQAITWQTELIERIVRHAELVIKEFEKYKYKTA